VGVIAKCTATKREGAPCTLPAQPDSEYCWAHDPEHAEKRKKTASKAAKSKPANEITAVKKRIRELTEDVISGRVDRGKASVAFQGLGVLKGFIELERKIREQEEVLVRIEELEQQRGYRWGR
jgi:hypothetical protein